jgi:4-amino-4-deoxy-L-arabinose transferase-like glycosyltransferase
MLKALKEHPFLALILFLSFCVRFIGIFHDLPYSYYPDEVHFVNRAVSFGDGDLNPHWFNKPALYMYILFIEYGIMFIIGKFFNIFQSVSDYAIFYLNNTGIFYFIGRLTTTIFGVGAIFLTYRIGKEIYGKYIGILAALFVALTFGHYESSIQIKADMPATFFTLVSFLFVYRIYKNGDTWNYILAGLFAGLGMATKYYSLVLLVSFGVAHYFRERDDSYVSVRRLIDRDLCLAYMFFFVGFFVGSPYNFLDPTWAEYYILPRIQGFLHPGLEGDEILVRGVVGIGFSTVIDSLLRYVQTLLSARGMGLSIGGIAIVGLIYSTISGLRDKKNLVIVSFPWCFIILANYLNPFHSEPRHQLVLYPFIAICGATVLYATMNWAKSFWKISLRARAVVFTSIAVMILASPMWHILTDVYVILQPDPRTVAKAWIEATIPDGTKIVLDEYTPQLRMSRANLLELYKRSLKEDPQGQFTARLPEYYRYRLAAQRGVSYDIAQIRFPWWRDEYKERGVSEARTKRDVNFGNPVKRVGVMPLDFYIRHGYAYVITSSKMMNKLSTKWAEEHFPVFAQFYKDLVAKGKLVKEFVPASPHPRRHAIRVYRIGPPEAVTGQTGQAPRGPY